MDTTPPPSEEEDEDMDWGPDPVENSPEPANRHQRRVAEALYRKRPQPKPTAKRRR